MTQALILDTTRIARTALVRSMVWFNLRPAAYAHPDWWPDSVRAFLRDASDVDEADFSRIDIDDSDVTRDGSRLWLSTRPCVLPDPEATKVGGKGGVAKRAGHWQFEDALEKIFLLAPRRFNELVIDVGLSMHREALMGVLSGRALRALKETFGAPRIDFVLAQSESITEALPASLACVPERDFHLLDTMSPYERSAFATSIETDGARTLLEAISDVSSEFVWRAKLRWPRAWSAEPLTMNWRDALALRDIVNTLVLQPNLAEDAWLF